MNYLDKFLYRVVLLVPLTLLMISCQSTMVINALTPRDDFQLQKNIPYGSDARQKLDIYTPTQKNIKSAIVVFVHGGSWANGDKKEYLFVGQAFAEMGYVTVIPNYRLYPQAKFPDFIDDVAQAIATLKDLLPSEVCADPQKIILVGHSAGAHSVAMLATAPKYLARNHADITLSTWIGLAGPYDLPLDNPLVIEKFTTVTNNIDANPLHLANSKTPSALLIHGDKDTTVYPHHTRNLTKRLKELDVPVVTHIYPETNHTQLVGGLAKNLRFLNPVYQDIAAYLHSRQLDQECKKSP